MCRWVFTIFIFVLVQGCASNSHSGSEKIKDESAFSLSEKLKRRHTTKVEVLSLFGPPDRVLEEVPGNLTYVYEYKEYKTSGLTVNKVLSTVGTLQNLAVTAYNISNYADGVTKAYGAVDSLRGLSNQYNQLSGGEEPRLTLSRQLSLIFNEQGIVTDYEFN